MVKKKKAIITTNLSERARVLLAKAGYINYSNLKSNGNLSKFMSSLIEDKFKGADVEEIMIINELHNQETIARKAEDQMHFLADYLRRLREKKESKVAVEIKGSSE